MHDYTELSACSDCLLYVANGDENPTSDINGWSAETVNERWEGYSLGVGWKDSADHEGNVNDDLGFSWRPCDCCGSKLGGDRFKLYAYRGGWFADKGAE